MRKRCDKGCKNAFQDKRYGVGIRVHTETPKGEQRCTVCGGNPTLIKMQRIASGHRPIHG